MQISFTPADLKPIIQAAVAEALAQAEQERERLSGKLCYSEQEAARLLDLEPHQLRDERLRGRIAASSIVGRRIRYLRSDLLAYLLERRWKP